MTGLETAEAQNMRFETARSDFFEPTRFETRSNTQLFRRCHGFNNPVRYVDPLGLDPLEWWVPIVDPGTFYSRAHEIRLNSRRRYGNREEDSLARHFAASNEMALTYGPNWARVAGVGNEVQGFLWWDLWRLRSRLQGQSTWAANPADLLWNELGIWAATQQIQRDRAQCPSRH